MCQKTYNYLYRITNLLNGKIYIGCHQTNDMNDGYMGSGILIKRAIAKYGIHNFKKEILDFYEDAESVFEAERKIVTKEFIDDATNYNLAPGGRGGFIFHTPDGIERIRTSRSNKILAKNEIGNAICIEKDDPRWETKELVGYTTGKAVLRDVTGHIVVTTTDDPRYISGELVGYTKGKISVKDSFGNCFLVSKDDPRYISGELVGVTAGSTQTEESNKLRSQKLRGRPKDKRPLVTCIICKKTTDVANFAKWHSTCSIHHSTEVNT
jgi:hypothetical protein